MLSDAELRRLNSLIQVELDAGATPAKAAAALDAALQGMVVPGMDLTFDTGESERSLPGHVLLMRVGELRSTVCDRYVALSGAGKHYNGMFGDATMLRDRDSELAIQRMHRPAEPIAAQVTVCAHLLSQSLSSMQSEVAEALRRHLSGILLEYPVLLHPDFLVHRQVSDSVTEYTSLSSILARSVHGALPRYSHFHSEDEEGPIDAELISRLTAFAKHPCVTQALSRAATRVTGDTAGATSRSRQISFDRQTLLRSMLTVTGPRPQFLGSVMELDAMRLGQPAETELPLPFETAVAGKPPLRTQLDAMLAASTCAASGLVHITGSRTLPLSMRQHGQDDSFLTALRSRLPQLRTPSTQDFMNALRSSVARHVFLGRQDDINQLELEHNTLSLARGFVLAGIMTSSGQGAGFIAEYSLGEARGGRLPPVDTSCAVTFLKTVEAVGGFGDTDAEMLAAIQRLQHAVTSVPAFPVPSRDEWVTACEALHIERLMNSVISKASNTARLTTDAAPGQASLDFDAPQAEPAPAARRHRAGI